MRRGILIAAIVGWPLVMVVLAWRVWVAMWEAWAASFDGGSEVTRNQSAQSVRECVVADAAGSDVQSAAAAFYRSHKTALAFASAAVVLAIPAGYVVWSSYRTQHPPSPNHAPHNNGCVPISGGRQCPGG